MHYQIKSGFFLTCAFMLVVFSSTAESRPGSQVVEAPAPVQPPTAPVQQHYAPPPPPPHHNEHDHVEQTTIGQFPWNLFTGFIDTSAAGIDVIKNGVKSIPPHQ